MAPSPTSGQIVLAVETFQNWPADVIGRLALPDRQHLVDRLDEHRAAVLVEKLQRLGVGAQDAGADPHQEPALQQVVEHRRVRRDDDRVRMGQVDDRGAELDLRGHAHQRREEHHAVRDVLALVGQMLAAIALGKAQPVSQDEGLAILGQRVGIGPPLGVDRHGEESELHEVLRLPARAAAIIPAPSAGRKGRPRDARPAGQPSRVFGICAASSAPCPSRARSARCVCAARPYRPSRAGAPAAPALRGGRPRPW